MSALPLRADVMVATIYEYTRPSFLSGWLIGTDNGEALDAWLAARKIKGFRDNVLYPG
jgi:hypothetical protein